MKCGLRTMPARMSKLSAFYSVKQPDSSGSCHVCSYRKRTHGQHVFYAVEPMNLPGICCNRQDIYLDNYFPPVDMDSFCLSVSMSGPGMRRCVCARRWKFWFVQFWTWWLMSVDCGSRSVFRGRQTFLLHFSFSFFFLLRKWYVQNGWITWPTYEQRWKNLEQSQ